MRRDDSFRPEDIGHDRMLIDLTQGGLDMENKHDLEESKHNLEESKHSEPEHQIRDEYLPFNLETMSDDKTEDLAERLENIFRLNPDVSVI